MKVYCRPGATPVERLEGYLAFCLYFKSEILERVADLLVWATDAGPLRERAIRQAFSNGNVGDPAEALGMARAVLLLCGVAAEHGTPLTGEPRVDFANLMGGEYRHADLTSPAAYAVPSLLDAYHHMGAGYARGVDRVFQAVTGHTLSAHLRRALALLDPFSYPEASCGG